MIPFNPDKIAPEKKVFLWLVGLAVWVKGDYVVRQCPFLDLFDTLTESLTIFFIIQIISRGTVFICDSCDHEDYRGELINSFVLCQPITVAYCGQLTNESAQFL